MKALYNFKLTTPESRNKNRLTKIYRLKKENRVLSARRFSCYLKLRSYAQHEVTTIGYANTLQMFMKLSERIGKNGAKVQRLRTLIQQEKARWVKYQLVEHGRIERVIALIEKGL